ncbi:aldo/keto reductase [Streptomyces ginkgonis]|uniref:aldo/keto reductase n=1 Tax=Streptomyces ginkgonis TaxID=1812259 RepID=UPI002176C9CF|nr:aldo/keto reductase [Streptomyces ginkgonis]
MTAVLALGTHRCREVAAAAQRAATSPHPWVDTAPNYLAGRAHSLLAPVLAAHPAMGVSTKIGFLPAAEAAGALRDGAITPGEAATGHSITPAYIRWQLARNRAQLGRDRIDVLFVHNPERARPRTEQLAAAFTVLEEAVAAGWIGGYGVATWSGHADGTCTVPGLLAAARTAGGAAHHLVALQLPVNLVLAEPMAAALAGHGPIADAAAAGLEVYASAPLHGGELAALATEELADLIRPGLTPAGACILAAASCPGVRKLLLAASSAAHWDDAHAALAGGPLTPAHLGTVLDVLAPR